MRTEYLLSSVGRVSGGWRVRMLDTGNGRAPTAPLERVSSSRAGGGARYSRFSHKPKTANPARPGGPACSSCTVQAEGGCTQECPGQQGRE